MTSTSQLAPADPKVTTPVKRDFSMLKRRTKFQRLMSRIYSILHNIWFGTWKSLWHMTFGRWIYVKRTHGPADGEVATMTFVRRYTSIPVPRVWFTVHWRGCSYIYMSRASGIVLHDVWMTSTSEMRERVVQQLAGYVEQLRTLKSPYGPIICSILRGPVWDSRLLSNGTSGPFVDEGRMNYQLRHCTPLGDWPDDIQHAHTLSHYIVLTHGDLALRNIMAQGSVVTAILDWESAGWFPAHWEYCKARFGSFDCTAATWDPLMSKFIPPYDAESAADFHLFQMHWFPSVRASFE